MFTPTSLLRYLLRQQLNASRMLLVSKEGSDRQLASTSNEQGLSLLECLMAIAVILLTAAMITPPLFVATASRVQNRRAEQALQVAQGQIDRYQVLMAKGQNTPALLPAIVAGDITAAPAPTSAAQLLRSVNSSCTSYDDRQIPVTQVLPVDLDGDCQADFLMQTFREAGRIPDSDNSALRPSGRNRATAFRVGVRVYSFLANGNWPNLQTTQASLQLTNGQGSQRTRPLAVLYTTMYWSDRNFSLCEIQKTGNRVCN
jgi:type II secretory pathway pseudopilin PulG